jgi:hypothetical protein
MVSKRSDGYVARESGAAAFDWVILAVGVFGLALAFYSLIYSSRDDPPAPQQQQVVAPLVPAPQEALTDAVRALRSLPLLYPYFDEDWRQAQIAAHAALEDGALLAAHAAQYAVATGPVNTRIGADYLGVIEAEILRRGLDLPEGLRPFAEIHAELSAVGGVEQVP